MTPSVESGAKDSSELDAKLLLSVLVALKRGDFSKRMPNEWTGLPGKVADTLNEIIDMASQITSEFEQTSQTVGRQGKTSARLVVSGLDGSWLRLVKSGNTLIEDLVSPMNEMVQVIGAISNGDLSQTVSLEVNGKKLEGEFKKSAEVVNTVVERLGTFSLEVTRVAREVGTDGKLGGQAAVPGVAGTWKDLTESVNFMAANLTSQVRNIADVTTAVANGNLSRKITVDAKGEILELKNTVNTMVDQLSSFAAEVTRVAREVGTDGKLGGQAGVPGVAGTWKDLTESVNFMAANLTSQVRNIADVTTAVANGNLSRKITVDAKGEILELKNTINTMVDQLSSFSSEVTRVAREVGTDGKLGGQAAVPDVAGTWKDLTESVNFMAANLTSQVRNIADVTTAVAKGDLSRKITVDAKGEILELKNTINTMVAQLSSFSSEVTRVAREVGTDGKLGGQAAVPDVAGTWKDLTESVNFMAANLTSQVRNIADVTTAVAKGELSRKITVDAKGEILELKSTINTMVDQLSSFSSEVTRVAREVGTDGKLGGQAAVPDVAGTWKDLTESVNFMAANLTSQVRNIADVTTAVAKGDLSRKITVDAKGEILELKSTINTMVDQLSSFAAEVTRVAREVGTDGKLGGQAAVPDVAGTWKDLTESVNFMAANLTSQVRNIADVTTAVAKGDLSRKITVDAKGEILELKNTINTMVAQLSSFSSEVTRVAREVGTDGKLGGQAAVPGVAGTWKDLTESVNFMAANLTTQVRNIADVTTAVAKGDLSKKITVDVKGEILELKNTVNTMVDQLSSFAAEVTRVAREVGTDGKLGGQAAVSGVAGTWKDLTESVNFMAANLTSQVRNIAEVTVSVAKGDLSKTITVDAKGEILELKSTINTMVAQLSSFSSEVTRVAREVGTDGKLGGQAAVPGVAGTWKDLTESVNSMAANLTSQVRNIADVTVSVANGDLSKKITVDVRGEFLQLKETINTMVDQLRSFGAEVTRVAREVGIEGRLGGQAFVTGVSGTWKDLTESVNMLAANLTSQVRNIADVTTAVAKGDLSKKITVDVKGEILELKNTVNTMVDQLNSFSAEVTRVAREVGTEGNLGGQATVRGSSGIWKDLTDNVNSMAANLTSQVRGIAVVVTAVATGNLRKKLTVEAKGEIAKLADTINDMIDTLALFADQVTTVAREVGVDGKLGGQAMVPGAAGTWKDLTENVNLLAANLTVQVRAIAEVSTAVTKGDLTRSITVEAKGEVSELKNNINEMIRNLKETTSQNAEQDWLKTNLAKFTRLLQGQRDLITVSKTVLSELAPLVNGQHGVFYILEEKETDTVIKLLSSFAYKERKNLSREWRLGEGLVGQCAFEKQRILLTNVPSDYIMITSGLGEAKPLNIIVLPILFEGKVKAILEIGSFERFSATHQTFLDQLSESIGIVLNTIEANMRTEGLLNQSQNMAQELQSQQEELRQTNDELENKARLLEEQKIEVEAKNREVEKARKELENKAAQLTVTSKYKSEFLSNMSHELRTPLNSLIILSQQLKDNADKNLTDKQVQYATTVYNSGNDLLALINEILDLSKIESGTVQLDIKTFPPAGVHDEVDRTFRHVAHQKNLSFDFEVTPGTPDTLTTDRTRLMQILKNLLSNAIKFTAAGGVTVRVSPETGGWSFDCKTLNEAGVVVAFRVEDTGIGIPPDKQRIVFEAFQQADGGTSRKFGGTGLGLSISRELAALLGGELRLEASEPGKGSAFVLYIPQEFPGVSTGLGRTREAGIAEPPPEKDGVTEPKVKDTFLKKVEFVADDIGNINKGDLVLLIVENDATFAKILVDMAHKKGFKCVVTPNGNDTLKLCQLYKPDAVTLDLLLDDLNGWLVLDSLKRDPVLRHIPVDIISVVESRMQGLNRGAYQYLVKSADIEQVDAVLGNTRSFLKRKVKDLLLVEPDKAEAARMVELIGEPDINIQTAPNAKTALSILKKKNFDCLALNANLPDTPGLDLIAGLPAPAEGVVAPVIVYSNRPFTERENARIKELSADNIVKRADSDEQLLDETALFLHRVVNNLPEPKRKAIEKAYQAGGGMAGKKVLIVDDDMRNIFALTAALERYGMEVLSAEDGKKALDMLDAKRGINIVLMDIMMPEMDGYEVMRRIRKIKRFQALPVIALTAKAMRGDRDKCIAAGASDYVSKPVNVEQLAGLMKMWLNR